MKPQHEALLAIELANLAKYAAALEAEGVDLAATTFFVLDLRAEYGRRAGVEIAGLDLVEALLEKSRTQGTIPRVSFCLDNLEDAQFITEPMAPEVVPHLGRRSDGLVPVVVLDADGDAALALISLDDEAPL